MMSVVPPSWATVPRDPQTRYCPVGSWHEHRWGRLSWEDGEDDRRGGAVGFDSPPVHIEVEETMATRRHCCCCCFLVRLLGTLPD